MHKQNLVTSVICNRYIIQIKLANPSGLKCYTTMRTLALIVGISLVAIFTYTHLCEVDVHTFLVRGTWCAATVNAVLCALGASPARLTHAP